MRLQKGQSMVEYVIVCSALVSSLFWGVNAECDNGGGGRTKCISKLLTVMHDNYDGYSSSISAIQKYGAFAASGTPVTGGGGPGTVGGGGAGGGGAGGGGLNPDGLTEINQVTSDDGFAVYGELLPNGSVVDSNGNIVGFYSDTDNTFTDNNGNNISAISNNVVLDEAGNVLHLRAVTTCPSTTSNSPKPVYSWAYVSKSSDKVFNSLNKQELDIGSLCTEPSYKVVKNGQPQAGRILNSEYFAAIFAADVSSSPLAATGEVVYWADLGICSVMVSGWDSDVNLLGTDAGIYLEKLTIFNDPGRNLGEIDKTDYFNQTAIYGAPLAPNDCPTENIISQLAP